MNRKSPIEFLLLGLFALSIAFSAGCGKADPNAMITAVNKTNLERLVNLYERYQTTHKWKGPVDEASFKAFVNEMDDINLERMGIERASIDNLFTSERDNEPYKIRFGIKGSARGSNEAIIFETTGLDGTRLVGFTSRQTEEVTDDSRYDALLSGKAKEKAFERPEIPKGS